MASSDGKGKKVGANSRRAGAWWRNGGPTRMARRKARNHGCGKYALHTKPADQAHAHAPA